MQICLTSGARSYAAWAIVLFGLAVAPAANAQTVLKLGAPAPNEGLPIRVANDQGLFKSAGISLEFLDFKGGGPAVQAFAAGSTDLCVCSADHAIRLANRGLDARILMGLDANHPYVLMTRSDSLYSDIASLKGKRVAITSPGSLTDNTLRWAIKRAGLHAEKDFQILGTGGGAAMRAAIETGQVEAGTVVVTDIPEYLRSGKFRIMIDWRAMPYAALVVIARQRWIDANPAVAQAFVRAASQGSRLIQNDTQATIQTIKKLFPNLSEDHVTELAMTAKQRYSADGSVSSESFETMQDIVLLADATLKKVNKSDIVIQTRPAP